MSNNILGPLIGSTLRVENKEQLDEFLARPDAAQAVKAASFEEIFFTVKHVGLADSLDLLPLVSGKQVRGFIDLDCWRKDTFVRKPFMEWVAAFIQAGPEAHGFVDYYDALSIYATSSLDQSHPPGDRKPEVEKIAGEENPGNLPAVFADSLLGGAFLTKALEQITDPAESDRFAQELTALGNRILSANLVNLGELEGIRPALEEMRDFLTIGLERLTGGNAEIAPDALRKNYIQTVFKFGFDQVARLRDEADRLAGIRGFRVSVLDESDQQFIEGLRRFKPLLAENLRYRNFQSTADVDRARARLDELARMVEVFVQTFPVIRESLAKTFNTATVQC